MSPLKLIKLKHLQRFEGELNFIRLHKSLSNINPDLCRVKAEAEFYKSNFSVFSLIFQTSPNKISVIFKDFLQTDHF